MGAKFSWRRLVFDIEAKYQKKLEEAGSTAQREVQRYIEANTKKGYATGALKRSVQVLTIPKLVRVTMDGTVKGKVFVYGRKYYQQNNYMTFKTAQGNFVRTYHIGPLPAHPVDVVARTVALNVIKS